jgi:hypothetical protein
MDKVYFRLGGGFGDAIRTYVRGNQMWGYLQPLKERHPNLKARLVACCHNTQVLDLVKYNPYLDHIDNYGWSMRGRFEEYAGEYKWIGHTQNLLEGLKPKPTIIYLSKKDKQIITPIAGAGRYIAIHPFAGLGDRIILPPQEYCKLIDVLIDKYKFNVVLLGGSHTRMNVNHKPDYIETFDYERKGLFNLVSKTNGRVSVELVRQCNRFIGNWSCYSSAAWAFKKRSTVLAQPKQKKRLNRVFNSHWKSRGDCRMVYTEKGGSPDRIRAAILEKTF